MKPTEGGLLIDQGGPPNTAGGKLEESKKVLNATRAKLFGRSKMLVTGGASRTTL